MSNRYNNSSGPAHYPLVPVGMVVTRTVQYSLLEAPQVSAASIALGTSGDQGLNTELHPLHKESEKVSADPSAHPDGNVPPGCVETNSSLKSISPLDGDDANPALSLRKADDALSHTSVTQEGAIEMGLNKEELGQLTYDKARNKYSAIYPVKLYNKAAVQALVDRKLTGEDIGPKPVGDPAMVKGSRIAKRRALQYYGLQIGDLFTVPFLVEGRSRVYGEDDLRERAEALHGGSSGHKKHITELDERKAKRQAKSEKNTARKKRKTDTQPSGN